MLQLDFNDADTFYIIFLGTAWNASSFTLVHRLIFFNVGQPWPLLFILHCKAFYNNDITNWALNRNILSDKLCSLSGLISADRRESWVGVTVASWLYKTERLPSSHRQLPTRCPLVDALHAGSESFLKIAERRLRWSWGFQGHLLAKRCKVRFLVPLYFFLQTWHSINLDVNMPRKIIGSLGIKCANVDATLSSQWWSSNENAFRWEYFFFWNVPASLRKNLMFVWLM